jgi:WhiB family transcriptional regulator, redox-sensing transcriptional regulator
MTNDNFAWQAEAQCTGRAELFFDETRKTVTRKAKTICAGCKVRQLCLEYAIAADEVGVWGGKTTNERRRMRRLQRRARK